MKTIKFNIFLNLVLLTLVSNAQFSYQRLVDHNKIDKAFIKVNKRFESKPNDVSVLYDLSTLYVLLNKKKRKLSITEKEHNSKKAYLYAQKAINSFNKLQEADSLFIIKKEINAKTLKRLKYKACKSIFKNVRKRNTITDYKIFIRKYADCPRIIKEAKKLLYETAFKVACENDTKYSYTNFISRYPNADEEKILFAKQRLLEIDKEHKKEEKRKTEYMSKTHNYSKFKAIIVIGNDIKTFNVDDINKTQQIFKEKNITVKIFNQNENNWDSIVKESKGANFFIYTGHGTTLGYNHTVGGLVLNEFISSEQIEKELKLAPNAVVLLGPVCFSAGTSASDKVFDIGKEEAEKRVSNYALPFIKNNIAVYYAKSDNLFFSSFLNLFFTGITINEIYNYYVEENSPFLKVKKEVNKNYVYNSNYKIQFSSAIYNNTKYNKRQKFYTNATIYKYGFSIAEMTK